LIRIKNRTGNFSYPVGSAALVFGGHLSAQAVFRQNDHFFETIMDFFRLNVHFFMTIGDFFRAIVNFRMTITPFIKDKMTTFQKVRTAFSITI